MKMDTLLNNNTYPGRGIVLGRTPNGENNVIAYFIMGRSSNSRNRIFISDAGGIKTKAFDEAKLEDPSLIIYSPVRVADGVTIVTNGDQTDTVYNFLVEGNTFEQALRTRTFEPDAPNLTPRISGMITNELYKLSILKSNRDNPEQTFRFFYEYEPTAGIGHFIHTYKCDGDPIPSFEGEPVAVEIENDIDSFTNTIWTSLNNENKVSLFTRFINIKTGESATKIINKNEE